VTIVVEGGPDTLLTIYKDLRSHIPIVLIAVRICYIIDLIDFFVCIG
jgi:hypothetical protein